MAVDLRGSIRVGSATAAEADIVELSVDGFRMAVATQLTPGTTISLGLSGMGMVPSRVAWFAEGYYGCEFLKPLTPSEFAAGQAGAEVARPRFANFHAQHGRYPASSEDVDQTLQTEARWAGTVRMGILGLGVVLGWGAVIGTLIYIV